MSNKKYPEKYYCKLCSCFHEVPKQFKGHFKYEYKPKKRKRRYYKNRKEAMNHRKKGDRIYYDAFEKGYYIIKPIKNKKSFWGEW